MAVSGAKLRIKSGEHEFEAEGTAESVERQFELFKRFVRPRGETPAVTDKAVQPEKDIAVDPTSLQKILQVSGRVVSLRVAAPVPDAVLLLLLGQRQYRQNEVVSGVEVMNGLRESGLHVRRADNILARHARQGNVIAVGKRRTLRYRLSLSGLDRAEQIARELISQVDDDN